MTELSAAPVLYTPDVLEIPTTQLKSTLSEDALSSVYEIPETVSQLREGGWKRIGLQFPDHMLTDAPRVSEAIGRLLPGTRVYILADTSYSSCCVDEIAAEHADAEVLVHYGRACLSPTSRLPVIYVYTSRELDLDAAAEKFEAEFADKNAKVVIMADLTYQCHVQHLTSRLKERGYLSVVGTKVIRDSTGLIPNRKLSPKTGLKSCSELDEETLRTYSLFHISDPPSSLLLALYTRFASLHVLSTPSSLAPSVENPTMRTAGLMRRRFARVLSLASAGVIGILVNTLSVANSLASIDLLRKRIANAGKKSYTVVVGKLNAAKLANFSEIEGWVIVGCWEGGLIGEEQESGFWRPAVAPFEMEVALMPEEERIWGAEWWGGIEKLKLDNLDDTTGSKDENKTIREPEEHIPVEGGHFHDDGVEGDESLPPEFDLRTGRLVSHSRPMRLTAHRNASSTGQSTSASESKDGNTARQSQLVKREMPGEVASINGVASPGAEYLRSQRTWVGLGSDFSENQETSTGVEEGRGGIARGYTVGDGGKH